MISADEKYMRLALKLAKKGIGDVEPNPAVGAIIVKNNKIIGAGWHKKFGQAHAEINALENCKKKGANPKGATMFVTLEPCCHYGKTGPCTGALIAAKLKRVVVATIDPSKHANGKGIRKLRNAGMKVNVGPCCGEAMVLNAPFLKFAKTGKTWVTLKWAQSIDGKLAWNASPHKSRASRIMSNEHRGVSNEQSRTDAHKLRRQFDAILVGINTVVKDDPLLMPRPALSKNPLRIVLDNDLRIPIDCQLLKTASNVPLLIVTKDASLRTKIKKTKQITGLGAKVIGFPAKIKSNLKFILNHLSEIGVQHLLVEGGPTIIGSFLKENLVDKVVVYIAPRILGSAGCADIANALSKVSESDILFWCNVKEIDEDVRISGLTTKGFKTIFGFS